MSEVNYSSNQQDKYRGSSYPGFNGGSTDASGTYVPASTGTNPNAIAPSETGGIIGQPSTGLAKQKAPSIGSDLLSVAGSAPGLVKAGTGLYNAASGLLSSGGSGLEAGGGVGAAGDAAVAAGGDAGATSIGTGILDGDTLLSGAGTGVDSLGVAGGVADAATDIGADAALDAGTDALGAAAVDAGSDFGIGDLAAAALASVVCSELLNQRRITDQDRMIDTIFMHVYLTPTHYAGYIFWARAVVCNMRKTGLTGKVFTWSAYHIFNARLKAIKKKMGISKEGSIFGRFLRTTGEAACYLIGMTQPKHTVRIFSTTNPNPLAGA